MSILPLVALLLAGPGANGVLSIPFLSPTGQVVSATAEAPKVVVVDLWATWCAPCVAALPKLDALARDLGPRGVKVLAVSQDDDPALVQRFLKEVRLDHLSCVMDVDHRAARMLGPSTLPSTFVLDPSGTVSARFQGYTPGDEVKLRAAVEALLPAP